MRPSKSGAKNKDANSYYYYRCPAAGDDRCDNKLYLRGPWLWEVVVARLREVLFPLTGDGGESEIPDWLPELIAEVRQDLVHRLAHDRLRAMRTVWNPVPTSVLALSAGQSATPPVRCRCAAHVFTVQLAV